MLLKNYFSQTNIILCILMLLPAVVFATTVKLCGETVFQVKTINNTDIYKSQYALYYKKIAGQWKLVYKSDTGVFFHAACIQDKSKNHLLIFQEYCFGNGCSELTYGIFDPHTDKLVIKPTDYPQGNYLQIKKIIGYPPPFLSDYKDSFCCQETQM
jgi:hypothetical protein